jgi:phage gp45-like
MSMRSAARDAARRAFISISRGTIVKADDTKRWQEVEVRGELGERYKNVEHVHPYGFSATPKPPADDKTHEAAEAIIVFPDGSRSHPIVLAVGDRRYRLQLKGDGEVALHDDQGQQVYLARDRVVIHSSNEIHAQRGDAHVLLSGDKAKMQKGDMSVTCKGGKVYLGSESATAKVMTSAGESQRVLCVVDEADGAMTAAEVGTGPS